MERKYGVQSRPKLRVASRHRPCRSPPGVDGKSAHGMDGQAAIRSRFVPFPCRYGHQLAGYVPNRDHSAFVRGNCSPRTGLAPCRVPAKCHPDQPRPDLGRLIGRGDSQPFSRAWAWAKVGQTGARNGCASCRRRRVARVRCVGRTCVPSPPTADPPSRPRRGTPQRALGSGYPTGSEQVVHTVRVQWPLAAICL